MIPYAESIDPRDMLNYWGHGYILLRFDNKWSAYMLSDVQPNGRCTLKKRAGLAQAAAPATVHLSKEEFFEQALLHRPGLGTVLLGTGEIVHLSWIAARGDKIKSIIPEDIHIKSLGWADKPVKEEPKPELPLLGLFDMWADSLRKYQVEGGNRRVSVDDIYPDPNRMVISRILFAKKQKKPQRADTMKIVMRCLNDEPLSFRDAARCANKDGAAVDENGVWLRRGKGDTLEVNTGTTRLGTAVVAGKNAEVTFKPIKYKLPAKQRVIKTLSRNLLGNAFGGVS